MDCNEAIKSAKALFKGCMGGENIAHALSEHLEVCDDCQSKIADMYARSKILEPSILDEIDAEHERVMNEGHYSAFELVIMLTDDPVDTPTFARMADHVYACEAGCLEALEALKNKAETYRREFLADPAARLESEIASVG